MGFSGTLNRMEPTCRQWKSSRNPNKAQIALSELSLPLFARRKCFCNLVAGHILNVSGCQAPAGNPNFFDSRKQGKRLLRESNLGFIGVSRGFSLKTSWFHSIQRPRKPHIRYQKIRIWKKMSMIFLENFSKKIIDFFTPKFGYFGIDSGVFGDAESNGTNLSSMKIL